MTLKQRAEEFAKEFLDSGEDIDPDEIEDCKLVYLKVAREWAEKGFYANGPYKGDFKEWWKEIEGE